MNVEDSKTNLRLLSNINLNDFESYDVIFQILNQTILPFSIVALKKGEYIFRARPKNHDDIIKTKSDLSYRSDIDNITEFGRVNTPNQAMFYASRKSETAIFETSSLIRDNLKDIKLEKLILGRWFVKNDIDLLAIISNPDAIKKNKDLQQLNQNIEFDQISDNLYSKFVLDYLSGEFARNAQGNHNNYKISAAFYNLIQNRYENEIQGVMYPSVEYEYNDINIALQPRTVDNSLILDMVGEYVIDFRGNTKKIKQTGLGDISTFNIEKIIK